MPIDSALIDDCVHCGFCLPTCPTYGPLWQQEMDSPRGRIWLMKGLAEGTLELTDTVVEHFDRCLGCMACVTSCPSGVKYDRLIEQTRELIEERHEREPADWLVRAIVFGVLPHPRRMRAALALAPLGRHLPMPGFLRPLVELAPPWRSARASAEAHARPTASRAAVSGSCSAASSAFSSTTSTQPRRGCSRPRATTSSRRRGSNAAARSTCTRGGGQRATHARTGSRETCAAAGAERIVVNAAGCGSHLKDAGLDLPVVDVSELLAEAGPRAERHGLALTVAFQDSCHLLHAQRVQAEPRELLRSIPGLELAEPAEAPICCGSAGIYNVVQPRAAAELGERKARHVAATGADVYASANPGCLVQVSSALRRAGDGAARPPPGRAPGRLDPRRPGPSRSSAGRAASRLSSALYAGRRATVKQIAVTVNGQRHEAEVEPRQLLVYFLREQLRLTGTNVGCDTSSCGSCTVLLDGESVKSCTLLAVQADGREVTTIEGLADNGTFHPVQQAFHEHHALQCGFCTPGMVMAAVSYLEENPKPTEAEVRLALEGNLCRCTGYHNIVKAILAASGAEV